LQSGERVLVTLTTLRNLGFSIAIDDFGTGYSSLSHLRRLPIDTLKVDRTFMRDTPADKNNAAIVSAIVLMAHSLGLNVVAEGVELIEQVGFLRTLGCDEAQGFLFSKAVTPEEIEAMIRQNETMPFGRHL